MALQKDFQNKISYHSVFQVGILAENFRYFAYSVLTDLKILKNEVLQNIVIHYALKLVFLQGFLRLQSVRLHPGTRKVLVTYL